MERSALLDGGGSQLAAKPKATGSRKALALVTALMILGFTSSAALERTDSDHWEGGG